MDICDHDGGAACMDALHGIYLYCLVDNSNTAEIRNPGLDGRSAVASRCVGDLAAWVELVALDEWTGPAGDAHLQDVGWVVPRAARHLEVVAEVMTRGPVLPARMGTLFSSWQALDDLVDRHRGSIRAFLVTAAECEEWAVKGLLDRKVAEAHVLAETPIGGPAIGSQGARYLLERRRKATVGREVSAWASRVRDTISEDLEPFALSMRSLRLVSSGGASDTTELAFNWAFLVHRDALAEFRTALERASVENSDRGLALRLSGPWPPYNFCPSLCEDCE